ncbi:endonuclease [Rummeliibacillus stabekisii]|uniref:endonuclease n=1 Tax=Rummeliibacillus stabekisii TaxID=241244 RepID=UPI002041FAB9|nr:endonuclease [Rummeliibacillus stabekisii]MCM3315314.1 endonuclease [Rummeliibacillus stabekisii]
MNKRKWKKPLNAFLSTLLTASILTPALPTSAAATGNASELIISEYIEGSSSNKAIELYNGTGSTVDLSQYSLELYANGATTATATLKLSGSIQAGDTYVIYNNNANESIKSKGNLANSTVINFNGDDAVVLKKANAVIDSLGQVGARVNNMADLTLVRKETITSGDTVIDDAFEPTKEWDKLSIDDVSNLGKHSMDGSIVEPGNPSPVEIKSIEQARALPIGDTVTIKAVVAAKLKNTISVQDETGGIAVRPATLDAAVGDEVTLTGKLADYKGLLQLDGAQLVEKKADVGAPTPKAVTGAEVTEENESRLVKAKNIKILSVEDGSTWANYTVTDGTTEFVVRDEAKTLNLAVGKTYDSITGIVQQFDNVYQVIPRSTSDIVEDASVVQPVTPSVKAGAVAKGTELALTTPTDGATIYYTTDGTEPTKSSKVYSKPITIQDKMTVKVFAVKDGLKDSPVASYEYTVFDSAEGIQIHDIQGESHDSQMKGKTVSGIEGIVTYIYKIGSGNYFHMQTPDSKKDNNSKTSEGIIVYTGNTAASVKVGDLVSVNGKVDEFQIDGYADSKKETDLSVTQLNARNDQGGKVGVLKSNVTLPEPVVIDRNNLPSEVIDNDQFTQFDPQEDAIDFWESLEGMRVQVGNVKAVGPQDHGDLVTVLEDRETDTIHGGVLYTEDNANADRIQFKLYDNTQARDFKVATGDKFKGPITGVVNYGFSNYKIYADYEDMKAKLVEGDSKPETTTIVKEDDKLTVASYNLENFSNNTKETSEDKAGKLARAIASDMKNPDIVGVTEVQDNNGSTAGDAAADQSYKRLIAKIEEAGGVKYNYANIDPENNADGGAPNANIRVGFLYNPDRVQLTKDIPSGDATTAVDYKDGKLSLNPGRIDPTNPAFDNSRKPLAAQFDFKGESVVVIANHWNSKSGDTPLFGSSQPPKLVSEVQRHKIATIVRDFTEKIKSDNPDANIVSVGDYNDFQFTDSLKILEGKYMSNMINKVEKSDRYTYVYQGNSQVLDHILVSNNLANSANTDILHINSDFTDMAGRASDHDPVMVQLDLADSSGGDDHAEQIVADKYFNFTKTKTKKLTIASPSVGMNFVSGSITEGIIIRSSQYAELKGPGFAGKGFEGATVTVKPNKAGLIVNFSGLALEKVIIDGPNVKEIRGAENLKNIEYINGANPETIQFRDSEGKKIEQPNKPAENNAPVAKKDFDNQTVTAGKKLNFSLADYFLDPDGDKLTFSSTMGTINGSELTLDLPTGTHLVAVTASDGKKSVTSRFSVTVTTANATDQYYSDAIGKEGQALKTALHDIIDDNKVLSYSEVWDALKITDEDPKNKNNVILLYTGESRSKDRAGGNAGDWNREHTWAKSHGNFGTSNGPGTDIHHLRPADVQVNGSRGNLDFDNGGNAINGCSLCKRDGDSFEPPNEVKGDIARMLFYMATRYEKGDRVDLELNDQVNNGTNPYHGKLSVLKQWNKQDPVSEWEKQRNEKIFNIQGNRNPFVDHPEWVEAIW